VTTSSDSTPDLPTLDALTSGALTAPTSGERSSRLRDWLASDPSPELMQQVFKEMSARDKGASKLLREKLDELKRTKIQDSLAQEWADKAQSLLQAHQFKVADAMAWQRDAAKAGAPLSREPLAGLRQALTERIKHVDELEHRAQVQRETALLLTQRIEVLSTKSWQEAIDQQTVLQADLKRLHDEFEALQSDAHWSSVDPKYPSLVAETTKHIPLVWDAFSAALAQTQAAAQDANLPLPAVPAWADQLRQSRGESVAVTPTAPANNAKAEAPPQVSQVALQVPSMLLQLEKEVALGHSKAMSSAASLLRAALKTKGLQLDTELAQQVQTTLAAAAELEGWQRKRADEIRLQLVTKAEALLQAPVAAPAATEVTDAEESQAVPETSPEGDTEVSADAASTVPEVIPEAGSAAAVDYSQWVPAMGGRKLQDTLRQLRDEWKKTDQGGLPNHGLWKRFDQACNRAYPFVQAWLGKAKAESAAHREGRLALLAEVAAWTEAHQSNTDWKTQARELHQFSERWRNSGHLSEKAFADMQTQWKAAIKAAHVGLEAAQTQSITLRRAMIEEAKALGEAPQLRIDAVKALQQRWQIESQAVPVDRKLAQKLWDAFRQPLDEAFSRKTQSRAAAPAQNLSEHDKAVMAAAEELEKAIAQGDAAEIRQAMAHMNAVSAGQAAAPVATSPAPVATPPEEDASPPISEPPEGEPTAQPEEALAPAPKTLVVKKVVAVRGDDRPGQKKTEPASAGRFGDKSGPRRPERDTGNRRGPDAGRGGLRDKPAYETRGPRLGDAAFHAQRQALELADTALRKLAMQAHGETLVHLLGAWQQRQSEQLPAAKELGARLSAQQRQDWAKALQAAPQGSPDQALLRLEIAAEVPTPASHVDARRMLQLQLLTKRNDAGPAQTWAQDVAQVLGSIYEEESAKRVQAALKVLLKK
jgi:ATP-dependent RNA helicase SUPV3L1/SUV3